jgi:hypothetical protein
MRDWDRIGLGRDVYDGVCLEHMQFGIVHQFPFF